MTPYEGAGRNLKEGPGSTDDHRQTDQGEKTFNKTWWNSRTLHVAYIRSEASLSLKEIGFPFLVLICMLLASFVSILLSFFPFIILLGDHPFPLVHRFEMIMILPNRRCFVPSPCPPRKSIPQPTKAPKHKQACRRIGGYVYRLQPHPSIPPTSRERLANTHLPTNGLVPLRSMGTDSRGRCRCPTG